MRGLDLLTSGRWRQIAGSIPGHDGCGSGRGPWRGMGQGAFQSVIFPIEARFAGPYSWAAMNRPHPPHPIPDAAALPEAPCDEALVARQVRLLGGISMAGTRMTQRMWRQANDAKYLGAEGALMFARIARAVRQTIAMERRLGAHAEADSKQQQAKLFAISNAGEALVDRLIAQDGARNWMNGQSALMMIRLTVATERTMALMDRIADESKLTPAERTAAQRQRAERAAAKARRQHARQIQTGTEPPAKAGKPVGRSVHEVLLAEAVSDFEGDPEGSERADAQALDERLPPEDLTPVSVEDEIGGRSLAEIAAEACRLTGIEPEPGLFEAAGKAGEAAAAEAAQTDAPVPLASPTSPDLSAPTGRRGEDGDGSGDSPPIAPRESKHDPPSG